MNTPFVYFLTIFLAVLFAGMYGYLRSVPVKKNYKRLVRFSGYLSILLSFFSLFLLSGFRVGVGIDYVNYERWFYDIYTYDYNHIEIGFIAIVKSIQVFTMDSQWLFIIMSLLTFIGLYISIIKFSKYPALSVFLFCCMGFLSHSLNLSRQFIAIMIILYAYRYVINGSLVKYVMSVFLASLFHQTALILLPIYFLLRLKLNTRWYIVGIIVSGGLMALSGPIKSYLVNTFYPQYYDAEFVNDVIISPYYIMISIGLMSLVVFLLIRKRLSMENIKDRFVINMVYIVSILHIFLAWVPLSNRVSLYMDISLIIIIPYLVSLIETKFRRRVLIVFITAYFAYFAFLSFSGNANGVLPYRSTLLSFEDSRNKGGLA